MSFGKFDVRSLGLAITPRRRKTERVAVRSDVTILSSAGESSRARIADLSTHGCNLVGENARLRIGGFIEVSLETGDPMHAIIRWKRGEVAGVEFLRPIPPDRAEWHDLLNSA